MLFTLFSSLSGSFMEAPSGGRDRYIIWKWNLTDCSSFVRNDSDQKLEILQSGMYFIYAQVTRITTIKEYFTMTLYKNQNILLNQMTGTNTEEDTVSINFGRPYFLSKGDKLFCSVNSGLGHISKENRTYWGLYAQLFASIQVLTCTPGNLISKK
uniref:THD domain-containing protein n=1 Tax=Chelydra serpentina TaxID=8475 RepID=A0A8C3SIY5_CHESE